MTRLGRRVCALVALAAVVSSKEALARERDPAAATALFRDARAALEAKDYATACPKLEESMRLDPHVGTLISLAQCEEGLQKIAIARTHWQQAVDLARAYGDSREGFAAEQLAKIDARVPRLTLRRSAHAPLEVRVKRDGVEVSAASQDLPLPVELGFHAITIEAPGHWPRSATVELAEGESKEIVLEPGAPLPLPTSQPLPKNAADTTKPAARSSNAFRIGAIAAGAGGVIGIGLGAYFGAQAISGKSGKPGVCNGDVCDPQGGQVRRDAFTAGNDSTVAFIVGSALVATGVVLWIAAPSQKQSRATLRLMPAIGSTTTAFLASGSF